MRQMWRQLGDVPALWALIALYALAVPVALLFDDPVDTTGGVVLFGLFIAYCVARPHHGVEVFLYAGAPGALGTMLHDVFEISRLWGLAVLPITLFALRDIDREQVDTDADVTVAPERL